MMFNFEIPDEKMERGKIERLDGGKEWLPLQDRHPTQLINCSARGRTELKPDFPALSSSGLFIGMT